MLLQHKRILLHTKRTACLCLFRYDPQRSVSSDGLPRPFLLLPIRTDTQVSDCTPLLCFVFSRVAEEISYIERMEYAFCFLPFYILCCASKPLQLLNTLG